MSPGQRAWQRFRAHRRAWWSLWVVLTLLLLSLGAGVLSNDRPLYVHYQGQSYWPLWHDYPETTFGGDFVTPTDYLDPYIRQRLQTSPNFAWYPPNPYRFDTLNYFATQPNPAPPSADNWLGTDDRGRDILARLIYGFRVSLLFSLALTAMGVVLGVVIGAVQGYFAGRVDLWTQRVLEVWGSLPELYLLIIFASVLKPSLGLLLALLTLFGWMGLADYVRAEFLKNRNMDYVLAARAMGLGNGRIMWRHILPNSLTPVLAFLPFRLSGGIVMLTSLDYLGLGVPADVPSLGEMLAQAKGNLEAWWIALPTFGLLVSTLILLVFVGEGLREAFDVRK